MKFFFFGIGSIVYALIVVVVGKVLKSCDATPPNLTGKDKPSA